MRCFLTLAWGYIGEILLTAILYSFFQWYGFGPKLGEVLNGNWPMLSAPAGVLFAAGIGALIFFAQSLDSPFGKYLGYLKADGHYLRAFKLQSLVFLIATLVPVLAEFWRNRVITHVSWLLFLYACINGITLVTNVVDIVKLRQKFLFEYDLATKTDSQHEK
jgi:hypothetical protein